MTLLEALKQQRYAGYTHAADHTSYRGRKIENWYKAAERDTRTNWAIEDDIIMLPDVPEWGQDFRCWKDGKR